MEPGERVDHRVGHQLAPLPRADRRRPLQARPGRRQGRKPGRRRPRRGAAHPGIVLRHHPMFRVTPLHRRGGHHLDQIGAGGQQTVQAAQAVLQAQHGNVRRQRQAFQGGGGPGRLAGHHQVADRRRRGGRDVQVARRAPVLEGERLAPSVAARQRHRKTGGAQVEGGQGAHVAGPGEVPGGGVVVAGHGDMLGVAGRRRHSGCARAGCARAAKPGP